MGCVTFCQPVMVNEKQVTSSELLQVLFGIGEFAFMKNEICIDVDIMLMKAGVAG